MGRILGSMSTKDTERMTNLEPIGTRSRPRDFFSMPSERKTGRPKKFPTASELHSGPVEKNSGGSEVRFERAEKFSTASELRMRRSKKFSTASELHSRGPGKKSFRSDLFSMSGVARMRGRAPPAGGMPFLPSTDRKREQMKQKQTMEKGL
jgi:hypothetical protein